MSAEAIAAFGADAGFTDGGTSGTASGFVAFAGGLTGAMTRAVAGLATAGKVPYTTTIAGSLSTAQAIGALKDGSFEVRPLQDYF